MSSAAYFRAKEPIHIEDWLAFCDRQGIVFSPNTVGQNVFYAGDVEIRFGDDDGTVEMRDGRPIWETVKPPLSADNIVVSTYYGGSAIPNVGRIASEVRRRWKGYLRADPEVRRYICVERSSPSSPAPRPRSAVVPTSTGATAGECTCG